MDIKEMKAALEEDAIQENLKAKYQLQVDAAEGLAKDMYKIVQGAPLDKKLREFLDVVPVSAKTGDGLSILEDVIEKNIESGPMYYPEEMVTDQSEKQIAAEIIREKMLMLLDKEVPHGIAVEIVKMKEGADLTSISANIYCEKDSHKGIIIGKGGETLKKIGALSRKDLETMLETKVFLELWVKVKKDWRNSNFLMKEFGLIEKDN